MIDRQALKDNVEAYRIKGEAGLRASGAIPDSVLLAELARPGTDQRCGVNLVCRPTGDVASYIKEIQRKLSKLEPTQYYYPSSDLHLTLLELCHSRKPEEATQIATQTERFLNEILTGIGSATVDNPILGFDERGCALNFIPVDDALQEARTTIRHCLETHGIAVDARYLPKSAHVSLMRYISPLATSLAAWVDLLKTAAPQIELKWKLQTVWMTQGPNWYGIRSQITEKGPYALKEDSRES